MTGIHRDLLTRRQLVEELGISDSTERRKRKGGQPWPPHLFIGNKVYYLRKTVEEFLQAQEKACPVGPGELAAGDQAGEAADVDEATGTAGGGA